MSSQYTNRICNWLRANPGRQQTKDIADGVSVAVCGLPAVQRAEDRQLPAPNCEVVYDTITKQLFKMTQDGTDFIDTLMRDGKGGWWLSGRPGNPLFDAALADLPILDHKPGKAPASRNPAGQRDTGPERRLLPQLLLAQHSVCAGCGKDDPRDGAFTADLIVPHFDGGLPQLGNVQALCYRCNQMKATRSQTELWSSNSASGFMWNEREAKIAHSAAVAMG